MMNFKLKSLALTCITSLSMLSIAYAQEKEMAEKVVATESAVQSQVLGMGSEAPTLEGVTWIQGDAVKSLDEKGKLYIIECWATWCGPCVAVIPHMNELHKKYADKGLVLIGMNVWEESIERAQSFVKEKGEGMSYRVASSGNEFESAWLKASNTQGIPQAFVVRDGKIIYKGHPGGLTENSIELMMEEDFNAEEFAKKQLNEQRELKRFSEKVRGLFQAKDWAGIKEVAMTDVYVKGKVDAAALMSQANKELEDWDAQAALLKDIVAGKYGDDAPATKLISYSLVTPEVSDKVVTIAKELEPLYAKEGDPDQQDYFGRIAQSRVLFMAGKQELSKQKLQSVLADVSKMAGQPGAEQFINKIKETIESIDGGKFPPFK